MVPKYMIAYLVNISSVDITNIDRKTANNYQKSKKISEQG
jgi:hypothetical protein